MLQINNCRVVGFVVVWIFILFYLFIYCRKQKPWRDSWWGITCIYPVFTEKAHRSYFTCWPPKKKKKGKQLQAKEKFGAWGSVRKKNKYKTKHDKLQTMVACASRLSASHWKKRVLCSELHGCGTSVFIIYTNLNHTCGFFSAEGNM